MKETHLKKREQMKATKNADEKICMKSMIFKY